MHDDARNYYNCVNHIFSDSDFYSYDRVNKMKSSETHREVAYFRGTKICTVGCVIISNKMPMGLMTRYVTVLTRRFVSWFQPFVIAFETALVLFLILTRSGHCIWH